MAKYGKNNYFDGIVLPEPKEEALRRMAKGVNTTRGYLYARSIDIDKYNGDRSFQVAFTTGDDITTTQYIRTNYPLGLVISNDRMYVSMLGQWLLGYDVQSNTEYDVVVSFDVTTRASTLYVNGQLIATRLREDVAPNYSKTYFLGAYPEQTNLFTGDIALCREFNFQIPKDVVALLHNNGDPAGYVVPLADKYRWEASESNIGNIRFYPNNEGSGVTSYLEDNANGFTGRYAHIIWGSSGLLSVYSYQFMGHPVGCVVEAKFKYRSNAPVRVLADNSSLPINMEDAADATIVYRTTGTNISGFSVTVPNADANSWVEIQPVSLRTLGCVAEYLPQNLIPTAEGSVVQWLDSASQLPEANGILPPLDASVGGYDLAAIGNPKIII